MTVSSQVSSVSFLGDGVTTLLPVPYYFLEQTHLLVTRVNLDSSTNTLVLGSDYSVSGAGNQAGGSITMIAAPAVGIQIIIDRSVPATQETDYVTNDPFPAESHERALDKLTMLAQQSVASIGRALLRPIGKNYYDAEGRQIKRVADPTEAQDATTMKWTGDFLSTIKGPVNNSANVYYQYPDGSPHVVQDLSGATGAYGVGKGGSTVGAAIDANTASIATNTQAINDFALQVLPNAAQPLMSRSNLVLNFGHGINIIGDSISAGAYQGNVWTNGWPALLAKAVNNLFGSKNIGAIPTDALYNPVPAYLTDQLHDVTWTGNWGPRVGSTGIYDWPLGNTAAAAGDAINGKTVVSTDSTAYMEIVVPSMNRIVNIYYVGRPDGGKFDVLVNGVIVSELNTFIATKTYNLQYTLIADDGGQGETVIRLKKKDSSPTELQSVIRYQKIVGNPDEHFALMNVSNMSISGRQLAMMTEAGIIAATNCACVVLALGYNDSQADTDDTYYATYLQRINWFIQYANVFKCLVIVADFCWYASPTGRRRAQLKRLAKDTKGIYIPFPDKFYPDGTIPTDTSPSASELVSTLRLFADNAHPNFKGNEMIFHEIAKAMGLPINTKRAALLADMPFPLKLQGSLINKSGDISSVSRVPNGLSYSLGVTAAGGGNISSGSVSVAKVPTKFFASPTIRATTAVIRVTSAGVIDNFVTTLVDGTVNGVVINASVIEGSFVAPENAT